MIAINQKREVVREIQRFLYELSLRFAWLPAVYPDGDYGPQTRRAVVAFQGYRNLPQTGEVDYATWEALYDQYRTTFDFRTREADPSVAYEGLPLKVGSRGYSVFLLRAALGELSRFYPTLPPLAPTSLFQHSTEQAVRALQRVYRTEPSGVVDVALWNRIFEDVDSKQTAEADRNATAGGEYPEIYDPGN